MSFTVVVQEAALRALARIRSEDKAAFATIRQALLALADQPRPEQTVAWGGSGIYRLHLPGARILYEVDDGVAAVHVINVALTHDDPIIDAK
jgi:mRNA-degrading endonuclease RelE of RelBE toxin-antitoxin system